jgi:ATP-dependent exoDNAse (exonuclease V) alpha subunit
LKDPQTGRWYDFTHKTDVVHSEVLTPQDAPGWMRERAALWQAVEAAEDGSTRYDTAQLARHSEVALPRERPRQERIALVREFAVEQFVQRGMVVDLAVHEPVARDGEAQPHAHLLLTLRELSENGFGGKVREWNGRALLQEWREAWAETVNAVLERAQVPERIDHRSLEAQGINREPEPKIGAAAQAMERRGIATERHREWREALERNAERALQASVGEVAMEVDELGTPGADLETLAVGTLAQAPFPPEGMEVRLALFGTEEGVNVRKDWHV